MFIGLGILFMETIGSKVNKNRTKNNSFELMWTAG